MHAHHTHSIDHLCTQIHTQFEFYAILTVTTPTETLNFSHNNDKIPTHSSTGNTHKMGPGPIIYKEKTTSHLETQPKTRSHVPFRTSLGLIEDRESQRGWVGGEKGKLPPWGRRPVEVELQSSRSGHGGWGLVRRVWGLEIERRGLTFEAISSVSTQPIWYESWILLKPKKSWAQL